MTRFLAAFLLLALAPTAGHAAEPGLPGAEELLADYNAGVRAAMTGIDSLWVRQEIIEPCDDGADRTATALLTYMRGRELRREVVRSELRYPSGEYRLESLVGPEVLPEEYRVTVVGRERMEGEACVRVELVALLRDVDHFDGTIWIAVDDRGPVRITGKVADPPFPTREILLDKSFQRVADRFRLVRRHTGEVEVGMILGGGRGIRHIFYEDYRVRAGDEDGTSR